MVKRLARIAARLFDRSKLLMWLFRQITFRGKGIITGFVTHSSRNDFVANCRGINFRIDFRDEIQKQIYFNSYELRNLNPVVKLVKPGWICFDVGANVGIYALRFAKKLNFKGKVYAFEPEATNFERLRENINLNEFARIVTPIRVALTNYDGTGTLYLSNHEQSGWHSLTEFKDIARSKVEVKTMKLDTFVSENSINRIDLIKIDVEANEFEMLEGAKECLRNKIFKYIFIEFNGPRLAEKGRNFGQFMNVFRQNGYFPVKLNLDSFEDIRKNKINPSEICENFLFEAH
jgi:FkbM family methyltransferase